MKDFDLDKMLDALGKMSDLDIQVAAMEVEYAKKDEEALEMNIERLTVFNREGNYFLLVKPNHMMPGFQINMFDYGHFNIRGEIDFELSELPDSFYRLVIRRDDLSYFIDLYNRRQLEKIAKFLDLEINVVPMQ